MEVGTIFLWGKSTPPVGALELDGSTFDTDEYPELYDHLGTDVLIDMRGEFVRGWAHGKTVANESSRTLGSWQNGTEHPFLSSDTVAFYQRASTGVINGDELTGSANLKSIGFTGSSSVTGYQRFTSRPRNVALMFCIQAVAMVGDTYQERVIAALEKIAEGVYHVEDAGGKKPLAKTIALLLAGLNINYSGD